MGWKPLEGLQVGGRHNLFWVGKRAHTLVVEAKRPKRMWEDELGYVSSEEEMREGSDYKMFFAEIWMWRLQRRKP